MKSMFYNLRLAVTSLLAIKCHVNHLASHISGILQQNTPRFAYTVLLKVLTKHYKKHEIIV